MYGEANLDSGAALVLVRLAWINFMLSNKEEYVAQAYFPP